jgi:pilus assembly protein CpaC
MIRHLRILAVAAAMALSPVSGWSQAPQQEPVVPGAEPPPPAAAPRPKVVTIGKPESAGQARRTVAAALSAKVSAPGETLSVALNKTRELTLPDAVKDVVIGNPDVADVMVRSGTQLYLVGRAIGQTTIFLVGRDGKVMARYEVEVGVDTVALKQAIAAVMPDEKRINVAAVGDSVFLSGAVRNDGAAVSAKSLARRFVSADDKVVNLLKVSAEQQVLLQVKVAEMQKTAIKELGVGFTQTTQPWKLGNVTIGNLTSTAGAAFSTTAFGSLAATTGWGALATSISVLESQGLVRTLVEPNLTAVSGETATMVAGGELPIPVAQQNGTMSVDYKPFGVLLNFTPVVMDPGRLSLKMSTEVSAIDSSISQPISATLTAPGLTVRRAASTVEMPSGGSIMIAGLLQNDINNSVKGFPGLMDVPVLGTLFRSQAFQRKETELVVIVSAYVVGPIAKPGSLSAPTDGFVPAPDLSRYLLDRLQSTYTRAADLPTPPAGLQGPLGYVMD